MIKPKVTPTTKALIVEQLKQIDLSEWYRIHDMDQITDGSLFPIYAYGVCNKNVNCSVRIADDFAGTHRMDDYVADTNGDNRYCLALWNQSRYRFFRGAEIRDLYEHIQKQLEERFKAGP